MQGVAIVAAALALGVVLPALAEDKVVLDTSNFPVAVRQDPNMRTATYSHSVRYRIVGNVGRATVISFGPDEKVKRFVFGDAVSDVDTPNIWTTAEKDEVEGSPLNNHLHMWGQRPGRTNLIVVTAMDDGGPDRVYQFDAMVRPAPTCAPDAQYCDDPQATYGLRFLYPEDDRRRAQERSAAARAEHAQRVPAMVQQATHRVARERLAVTHRSGADRNWCWHGQGDAVLGPNRDSVSDNRQEITMDFGGRPVPAFALVDPHGKDGDTIQPIPRDGLIVLPLIASRIRMRLGDSMVMDLINCGQDQTPLRHGTHTARPDVYRTVRTR